MFEYLGTKYVPSKEDELFFAGSAVEVAPRVIGCVLHPDNSSKDTAILIAEDEAYDEGDGAAHRRVAQLLPHGRVSPTCLLLNGPRINVPRDTLRFWRWGHPDHRAWLSAPFPQGEVA